MIDIGFTSDGIDHFPKEYAHLENKWVDLARPAMNGSTGKIVEIKNGCYFLLPYVTNGSEGYEIIRNGNPEEVPIAGTGVVPTSEADALRNISIANERNLRKKRIESIEEGQKLNFLESKVKDDSQLSLF